jgi:hypothetical protein
VLEFDNKVWNDLNVSSVNQWMRAYNDNFSALKQDLKEREQITNIFKELGLVEYSPVTDKDIYLKRYYFSEAAERAMVLEISRVSFPLGIPHLTQAGALESSLGNWKCRQDKQGFSSGGNFVARTGCDVPLAKGTNIEVTGITQNGPVAVASYTRSYVPNRIGERFLKEIQSFPRIPSLRTLRGGDTGQATFQLYDDGWRIVR